MNTSEAQSLAMRLLELQQRFESYVILHEEELREIKATLREMRRDVLQLDHSSGSQGCGRDGTALASQDGDEKMTDVEEVSSLLTL